MQIASVLHYLHGEGVVHLDLKPTNVVLMDGRPVLLDFDIARPVGARGSGAKPRGSAAFMAPEQIRCESAAPSMDLFALGAVLYEAATNTPAFEPVGEGLNRFYPQRVEAEGERQGMDLYELGAGAYPEFITHNEEFTR